jgi:hypothetical protein
VDDPDVFVNTEVNVVILYAVGFRPFSILFCQNQCKLAKVRVRTHDFQYIRETAYNKKKYRFCATEVRPWSDVNIKCWEGK